MVNYIFCLALSLELILHRVQHREERVSLRMESGEKQAPLSC